MIRAVATELRDGTGAAEEVRSLSLEIFYNYSYYYQLMVPINGLDRASSFDFHYSENDVYFSDSATDSATFSQSFKIRRATILEKTVHLEDFVTQGMVKVNKSCILNYRDKSNKHLFRTSLHYTIVIYF